MFQAKHGVVIICAYFNIHKWFFYFFFILQDIGFLTKAYILINLCFMFYEYVLWLHRNKAAHSPKGTDFVHSSSEIEAKFPPKHAYLLFPICL